MANLRSVASFGGLTMVSRVLGFARDVLFARYLGAGLVADVFFVAFKLPNFFRRLFAEGAFNAAFVPLFCSELERPDGGRAEARSFAQEALAVLLLALLVLTILFEIAMPWIMYGLAPGFVDEPVKFELAVAFTRATFPYLMLVSLVSLFAAILNGLKRFAAAAAAPVILNLTLIASLLAFHETREVAGRALAFAVTIAGVLQLLWLTVWVRRAGMALPLSRPRLTPRVRKLIRNMVPVAIGAGAVQVNLVIDIILASLLPAGSLSYLFFADRLNQLPIGVIGVAVGTVLLPSLSAALARGEQDQVRKEQARAVQFALLLTLPAAAALIAIPGPLIGAIFERGAFDLVATGKTANALLAYAMGLPAYVLIKVLTPAFYARQDTKTPVRIAVMALTVNVILNLILMGPFLHVGLALATAMAAWLNAGLLYTVLHRRGHFRLDGRLLSRLAGMVVAAALMGAGLLPVSAALAPYLSGGALGIAASLLALVIFGATVFFLIARLLGVVRWSEIRLAFRRDA